MTSAPSTHAAVAVGVAARGGWLYGPAIDLLLGAGLGYLVSIPLLLLLAGAFGLSDWPVAVGATFALFASGPHYGATILRVYEQRESRRRYAFFAVWVTIGLCALFLLGLRDAWVGSLLVTAYATWSPWHFSGQNYGLALMFLRRRGIPVELRVKRLLYASFLLSFGLTLLVIHGGAYGLSVASVPLGSASAYRFLSLGFSPDLLAVAVPLTALLYAACLVAVAALLLRHARPAELLPAASLVLVQALWFALPAVMRVLLDAPPSGLAFAVVWVSACHAAQYLWVTSYYARREDPSLGVGTYLGRALWAGSALTILPALVFAPSVLGSIPWDLGLAILLFSVVNLHHFILDGAIWKLRDGRVARLLLRDAQGDAGDVARPRAGWMRPAVAALGVAALGVAGLDVWEREFVINRSANDVETILRSSERLAWIGRDGPPLHNHAAGVLAAQGRLDVALEEYAKSLELYPTAAAWIGIGRIHGNQRRWREAADAFAAAVAVDPANATAHELAGRSWLELGRPDRARSLLERARELDPGNEQIREQLRRASAAEIPGY